MADVTRPLVATRPVSAGRLSRAVDFIFGTPPPRVLPDRVRTAIHEHQRSSEVLVCFAQFGAIAFFGSFYALTPKAFPETVPFEPVPWMLALYALFTAFRLVLALRDRLTPAFLAASVVIDIAVLMTTIWSFHLQYQQPPTIYLKAPTLLYVFILIALRTMRLEAGYIVLAGISAIVGWAILVGYAVATTDDMTVTRDFVTYMASHSILIGAEVDKVLSIGAVTAVLAAATMRARRLMIAAATETHAASELSRFFAPEVAREIRASHADLKPGDAVIRDAAVIMIDLRGFTRLAARLEPGETIAILAEYQRHMVAAIQDNGGSIDKYLGDGIMATFGAAQPSDTFAADALRALIAIGAETDRWNADRAARGAEPIRVGAAAAVGPVLFGVVGDASRLEFTVIGDAVNLAAKLEKHTKIAGRRALATRAALDLARAQGLDAAVGFDDLPSETVAGVPDRVDLVSPA